MSFSLKYIKLQKLLKDSLFQLKRLHKILSANLGVNVRLTSNLLNTKNVYSYVEIGHETSAERNIL